MRKVAEALDVSYSYRGDYALEKISFAAQKGDYIGIAGPNGSGKTTLLKILLGIIEPDEGSARIFGEDARKFSAWRKIGYLPQQRTNPPGLPFTVEEVVKMGLLAGKKFPRHFTADDNLSALRALETVGIAAIKDKLCGELSGGQQQRMLLARALAAEPELLLLDEPAAALDPEARENFYSLLEKLNRERAVTILLITHDLADVGRHVSKLLLLDRRLIFYGTREEFCHLENPGSYFTPFMQHMVCHRHDNAIEKICTSQNT